MNKKRNIYLASSWRNQEQPHAVAFLRGLGHEVYDFRNPPGRTGFQWSDVAPDWQRWTPQAYLAGLDHEISKDGFASDWNAMVAADTCVLLLPSGRSAHIEAGYFVGAGKDLFILLLGENEPERPAITIPLTQGFEAIVDEVDGGLAEFKWHVHPSKTTMYAARSVGPKGRQRTVFLHRAVMQAPDGLEVDHIDGNGLNNRRSNLRIGTRAQNGQNIHTIQGGIQYRGVFEDRRQPGQYRAAIRHLGKREYLGSHKTPEDAARAYDAAAREKHGEWARVNFPLPTAPQSTFTPELMYRMATGIVTNYVDLAKLVGMGVNP